MEMEYYRQMGVDMMRSLSESGSSAATHGNGSSEEEMGIRKGPWTEEEDAILANYVALHGEGHWNSLARCAGLKRTGKSCRLRWLNYLRPNVRRGNLTLQEQLLILDLHSRWGNRWSKIAQELPGRTDNEIKNYWRTRVVKQAKQLNCDVNSKQFRDALRFVWIPRLLERIQAASSSSPSPSSQTPPSHSSSLLHTEHIPPSSHDNGVHSYNNAAQIQSSTSTSGHHIEYSELLQPFEAAMWTHENICFLQQQLADDF